MRPRKAAPPRQYGDPAQTPFVRFDPLPIYPENNLYDCAAQLLAAHRDGVADPFSDLIKRGPLGGTFGILPECTWFALIKSFFDYAATVQGSLPDWADYCWRALEIMTRRPHQEAWPALRELVLGNINELSGWAHSFRMHIAEREKIFRGEDGHHYYKDEEGIVVEVVGSGAATAEEERLHFITDQLVHSYGFLHQFLQLYALFAVSDDFSLNPGLYHRWVKLMLPQLPHHGLNARWDFLHFDHSRTIVWRPSSNFCDPNWLAGEILGKITDTLDLDFWQKDRGPEADEAWLQDGRKFQYDFVVETDLRLGSGESAYLTFEGRVFRWINGTAERKPIISMSADSLQASEGERTRLNRLLSAIVWHQAVPLKVGFGVGGSRSPYPKTYAGRTMAGLRIDPFFLQHDVMRQFTDDAWFALALFREGINAGSSFYGYLCFWKVLDLVFPGPPAKRAWLHDVGVKNSVEHQRITEILASHPDLELYLREERLNALKHVGRVRPGAGGRSGPLNPDKPEDLLSATKDVGMMEDFARKAIRHLLAKAAPADNNRIPRT
jgi:hypothetical protein